MSVFAAEVTRAHDQSLPHTGDAFAVTNGGQNHDRIHIQTTKGTHMAGSSPVRADNDLEITVLQRMCSATLGSLITSLLVTPLDVVRVRLQSQSPIVSSGVNNKFAAHTASFQNLPPNLGVTACCREVFWVGNNAQYCVAGPSSALSDPATAGCAVEETQRKTFTSTIDGIRKIARNEGATTLWRGLSPTLLMAVPANVIYFTGYDWLRYSNKSPVARVASDTYSPLIAGSIARVAAALVVSPIEMFRTRMQATPGSGTGIFKSTLVGLHQMTQTQGYTSLWRGLTLTMWRDVPFSGIYWWGYEAVRNVITDARVKARRSNANSTTTPTESDLGPTQSSPSRRDSRSQEAHMTTFIDSFVAGTVSGAISALVTTPFDVGKTRQQVYKHSGDSQTSAVKTAAKTVLPEQLSMPRFLYHILTHEGPGGLFKGWAARCLKVAPSCGIMISSYEIGKRWARVMNAKKSERKEAL